MSTVIARVNQRPITESEIRQAMQGFAMQLHRKTMDQLSSDEESAIGELAREKVLAEELIFQHALTRGIVADEQAIEAEKQKVIANFPSAEEFYATLARAGIDPMSYHRMLRQDLTVQRMTDVALGDLPEASSEEVAEAYQRHGARMKKPAEVRAAHILLRCGDNDRSQTLDRLEDLRRQAMTGDFGRLAQEHSACPSAARGGDLGYFKRGEMAQPFCDAAFSQQVGEIGAPVETQFGLHLIKVLDRRAAVPLSLEEATPQIRQLLAQDQRARRLRQWVEELQAAAQIEWLK